MSGPLPVPGPAMRILRAEPKHLPGMARCHQSAFPGSFMTLMGSSWLEALYGYFLREGRGISVVAIDGSGMVTGLAVGGEPGIRGRFLRQALYRYPHLLALGFLRSGLVRAVLLAELAQRLDPATTVSPDERLDARWPGPVGNLLSIGIMPSALGSGLAASLLIRFQSECAMHGYRSLMLSVMRDNPRAIRFYARLGWEEIPGPGESARFALRLDEFCKGPGSCGAS